MMVGTAKYTTWGSLPASNKRILVSHTLSAGPVPKAMMPVSIVRILLVFFVSLSSNESAALEGNSVDNKNSIKKNIVSLVII